MPCIYRSSSGSNGSSSGSGSSTSSSPESPLAHGDGIDREGDDAQQRPDLSPPPPTAPGPLHPPASAPHHPWDCPEVTCSPFPLPFRQELCTTVESILLSRRLLDAEGNGPQSLMRVLEQLEHVAHLPVYLDICWEPREMESSAASFPQLGRESTLVERWIFRNSAKLREIRGAWEPFGMPLAKRVADGTLHVEDLTVYLHADTSASEEQLAKSNDRLFQTIVLSTAEIGGLQTSAMQVEVQFLTQLDELGKRRLLESAEVFPVPQGYPTYRRQQCASPVPDEQTKDRLVSLANFKVNRKREARSALTRHWSVSLMDAPTRSVPTLFPVPPEDAATRMDLCQAHRGGEKESVDFDGRTIRPTPIPHQPPRGIPSASLHHSPPSPHKIPDRSCDSPSSIAFPTPTAPSPNDVTLFRPSLKFSSDNSTCARKRYPSSLHNTEPANLRRRDSMFGVGAEMFGSLVGSFEESMLTGRLSAPPSKPIPFVCQIGVLAIGKCRPALRCPPHIVVPFSGYFYEWKERMSKGSTEDGPIATSTPYVGLVDLEWGLGPLNGYGYAHREREHDFQVRPNGTILNPSGCFPVPPKGQLQIVVKNPAKSVVKVFLIPYDCRTMKPITRMVVRQKIYAREKWKRKPDGNVREEEEEEEEEAEEERGNLRYAAHLQFLCAADPEEPGRRSIYLYKAIRLVFGHRSATDGDEILQVVNEQAIQQ